MRSDARFEWDLNETVQIAKDVYSSTGDVIPVFHGYTKDGFFVLPINVGNDDRGGFCEAVRKFFSAFGVSHYTFCCLLNTEGKDFLTVTGVSRDKTRTIAYECGENLASEVTEIGNLGGTPAHCLPSRYDSSKQDEAAAIVAAYEVEPNYYEKE